MPTVRDGRGRLTEYRVEPIGSPPDPVERAQVSAARMADFAAERVARNGAAAKPSRDDARDARIVAVLEAVRTTPSLTAAGVKVGVSNQRVGQIIHQLRRDRQLPADVDELLRARGRNSERAPRRAVAVPEQVQDIPPLADTVEPPVDQSDRSFVPADWPGGSAAAIEQEYSAPLATKAAQAPPVVSPSAVAVEEAIDGTVLHLTIRIDAAELARAMSGWPNYVIEPFVNGLARIVAAAKS